MERSGATMQAKKENSLVSLVVPVFNEAECLPELYRRIRTVMDGIDMDYECIFVNDGSVDESLSIIRDLHNQDKRVKLVSFSRNFGHQVALTAGLDFSRGDATITLDADLQHPPELIKVMIAKWQEGYDVVYTVRENTIDAGVLKKATSKWFYRWLKSISKTPISQNTADFRLLSRKATNALNSIRERYRFLRGLVGWIGFNQIAISYVAEKRRGGKSKYSLKKMMRFAMDGMTSFSSLPLYFSAILGFLVSIFSFVYTGFVLYWKFFTDKTIPGWTSIVVLMLFFGGVELICLGIMGEYLGKMYDEMKKRPLYLVQESFGFEA